MLDCVHVCRFGIGLHGLEPVALGIELGTTQALVLEPLAFDLGLPLPFRLEPSALFFRFLLRLAPALRLELGLALPFRLLFSPALALGLFLREAVQPLLLDALVLQPFLLFSLDAFLLADVGLGGHDLLDRGRNHDCVLGDQHSLDRQRHDRLIMTLPVDDDEQRPEHDDVQQHGHADGNDIVCVLDQAPKPIRGRDRYSTGL